MSLFLHIGGTGPLPADCIIETEASHTLGNATQTTSAIIVASEMGPNLPQLPISAGDIGLTVGSLEEPPVTNVHNSYRSSKSHHSKESSKPVGYANCFGLPYQDHNYGAPPPPTPPQSPKPNDPTLDDDTSFSIISTTSTTNEEELPHQGESITRCICGFNHDDEYMICCDKCLAWQHVDCMGLDRNNMPDVYMCERCAPRKVDKQKAKSLQARKREKMTAESSSDDTAEDNGLKLGGHHRGGRRGVRTKKNHVEKIGHHENIRSTKKFRTMKQKDKDIKKGKPRRRTKSRSDASNTVDEEAQDAWVYSFSESGDKYEEASCNQYTPEVQMLLASLKINGQHDEHVKKISEILDVRLCRMGPVPGGKGLITLQDVGGHQPITEYRGKVLLVSQFRQQNPVFNKRCYPYVLFYKIYPTGEEVCIDAREFGNEARFVRRSCTPNALIRHIVQNGSLRIFLFSCCEIKRNHEVTIPFDFNYKDCISEVDCACIGEDCRIASLHNKLSNKELQSSEPQQRRRRASKKSSLEDDSSQSSITTAPSAPITPTTPIKGVPNNALPIKAETITKEEGSEVVSIAATELAQESQDDQHQGVAQNHDEPQERETEKQAAERRKKMTREERKIDAYMRAFERMEKMAKRRQAIANHKAQQKQVTESDKIQPQPDQQPETCVKEEDDKTSQSVPNLNSSERVNEPSQNMVNNPSTIMPNTETAPQPMIKEETKPVVRHKKGKRRRGSGSIARRRNRTSSGGSDMLSPDENPLNLLCNTAAAVAMSQQQNISSGGSVSGSSPGTPVPNHPMNGAILNTTPNSVCANNIPEPTSSTPPPVLTSQVTGSPECIIPKSKRFLMRGWLQEKADHPPALPLPVSCPLSVRTEGWTPALTKQPPPCYFRCTKDSQPHSGISASHLRRNSASGGRPNTSLGSAKKRWLRQAMGESIDGNEFNQNSLAHEDMENGHCSPMHNGCLSPGPNCQDVGSPSSISPPGDHITPLKKRRLMRESLDSVSPGMLSPGCATLERPASASSSSASPEHQSNVVFIHTGALEDNFNSLNEPHKEHSSPVHEKPNSNDFNIKMALPSCVKIISKENNLDTIEVSNEGLQRLESVVGTPKNNTLIEIPTKTDFGEMLSKPNFEVPAKPNYIEISVKNNFGEIPEKPSYVETPKSSFETLVKPNIVDTLAKTNLDETLAKPVFVETPTKPVFVETSTKPVFVETPTKPVFGEPPAKPVFDELPAKPVFGETPAKPFFGETPANPVYVEKPANPIVDETSANSVIVETLANPFFVELAEKPNIVETPAEKSNIVETPAVKPNFVETPAEKPNFVQTLAEKPNFVETLMEKPNFVETLTEKPNFVETLTEKPNFVETLTEKPNFVETLTEKPNFVETLTERPNFVETPAEKPNFVETPAEKPNFVETPAEKPNFVETPAEKPNFVETPAEKHNFVETLAEYPNFVETQPENPNFVEPTYKPHFVGLVEKPNIVEPAKKPNFQEIPAITKLLEMPVALNLVETSSVSKLAQIHAENLVDMPVETKLVETPVEIKLDNTPSESKLDNTPSESKLDNTPSESKLDNTPSESKLDNTPSESKLDNTPSESKLDNTPAESKLVVTSAESKLVVTSSESKLVVTSAESKLVETLPESKLVEMPVESKLIEIPAENVSTKKPTLPSSVQIPAVTYSVESPMGNNLIQIPTETNLVQTSTEKMQTETSLVQVPMETNSVKIPTISNEFLAKTHLLPINPRTRLIKIPAKTRLIQIPAKTCVVQIPAKTTQLIQIPANTNLDQITPKTLSGSINPVASNKLFIHNETKNEANILDHVGDEKSLEVQDGSQTVDGCKLGVREEFKESSDTCDKNICKNEIENDGSIITRTMERRSDLLQNVDESLLKKPPDLVVKPPLVNNHTTPNELPCVEREDILSLHERRPDLVELLPIASALLEIQTVAETVVVSEDSKYITAISPGHVHPFASASSNVELVPEIVSTKTNCQNIEEEIINHDGGNLLVDKQVWISNTEVVRSEGASEKSSENHYSLHNVEPQQLSPAVSLSTQKHSSHQNLPFGETSEVEAVTCVQKLTSNLSTLPSHTLTTQADFVSVAKVCATPSLPVKNLTINIPQETGFISQMPKSGPTKVLSFPAARNDLYVNAITASTPLPSIMDTSEAPFSKFDSPQSNPLKRPHSPPTTVPSSPIGGTTVSCGSTAPKRKVSLSEYRLRMKENVSKSGGGSCNNNNNISITDNGDSSKMSPEKDKLSSSSFSLPLLYSESTSSMLKRPTSLSLGQSSVHNNLGNIKKMARDVENAKHLFIRSSEKLKKELRFDEHEKSTSSHSASTNHKMSHSHKLGKSPPSSKLYATQGSSSHQNKFHPPPPPPPPLSIGMPIPVLCSSIMVSPTAPPSGQTTVPPPPTLSHPHQIISHHSSMILAVPPAQVTSLSPSHRINPGSIVNSNQAINSSSPTKISSHSQKLMKLPVVANFVHLAQQPPPPPPPPPRQPTSAPSLNLANISMKPVVNQQGIVSMNSVVPPSVGAMVHKLATLPPPPPPPPLELITTKSVSSFSSNYKESRPQNKT